MISFSAWILFGVITGAIVNLLDQNDHLEGGLMGAVILGTLGAMLGGLLANLVLQTTLGGFGWLTFLIAAIGSVSLLLVSRALRHLG